MEPIRPYGKFREIMLQLQQVDAVIFSVRSNLEQLQKWKSGLMDKLHNYYQDENLGMLVKYQDECFQEIINSYDDVVKSEQWQNNEEFFNHNDTAHGDNKSCLEVVNNFNYDLVPTDEKVVKPADMIHAVWVVDGKNSREMYRCRTCRKTFSNQGYARLHFRRKHLSNSSNIHTRNKSTRQKKKKTKTPIPPNLTVKNPHPNFNLKQALGVSVIINQLKLPHDAQKVNLKTFEVTTGTTTTTTKRRGGRRSLKDQNNQNPMNVPQSTTTEKKKLGRPFTNKSMVSKNIDGKSTTNTNVNVSNNNSNDNNGSAVKNLKDDGDGDRISIFKDEDDDQETVIFNMRDVQQVVGKEYEFSSNNSSLLSTSTQGSTSLLMLNCVETVLDNSLSYPLNPYNGFSPVLHPDQDVLMGCTSTVEEEVVTDDDHLMTPIFPLTYEPSPLTLWNDNFESEKVENIQEDNPSDSEMELSGNETADMLHEHAKEEVTLQEIKNNIREVFDSNGSTVMSYECTLCTKKVKSFKSQAYIITHIRRCHFTASKECFACHKSFHGLLRHQKKCKEYLKLYQETTALSKNSTLSPSKDNNDDNW